MASTPSPYLSSPLEAMYQPRCQFLPTSRSTRAILSPSSWKGMRLCHQSRRFGDTTQTQLCIGALYPFGRSRDNLRCEVRASAAAVLAEPNILVSIPGPANVWSRTAEGTGTGFEDRASAFSRLTNVDVSSLSDKYRPRKFEDLIGHANIATSLLRQVKRGKPHRAYLFNGPRGTGKTSAARILAAAVNCVQNSLTGDQRGDPCGCCPSCRAIFSGQSIDVKEVDAASNSGVDNMRGLLESVQYQPHSSRFKVYILDECHMLSGGAANAVLKTLEEPPSHVMFILVTTDPQRLPVTVKDRCQEYLFRKIKKVDTVGALRQVADRERVQVAEGALELLAHLSEGSMRDAVKKLERVAESDETVTVQLIEDVFDIQASLQPLSLLSMALQPDQETATMEAANSLLEEVDAIQLAAALTGLVMDLVSRSTRLDFPKTDPVQEAARKKLTNMAAKKVGKKKLKCALQSFSQLDADIRHVHRPDQFLKSVLLQLSSDTYLPPPPVSPALGVEGKGEEEEDGEEEPPSPLGEKGDRRGAGGAKVGCGGLANEVGGGKGEVGQDRGQLQDSGVRGREQEKAKEIVDRFREEGQGTNPHPEEGMRQENPADCQAAATLPETSTPWEGRRKAPSPGDSPTVNDVQEITTDQRREVQESTPSVEGSRETSESPPPPPVVPPEYRERSKEEVVERCEKFMREDPQKARGSHLALLKKAELISHSQTHAKLGFPSPTLVEKAKKKFFLAALIKSMSSAVWGEGGREICIEIVPKDCPPGESKSKRTAAGGGVASGDAKATADRQERTTGTERTPQAEAAHDADVALGALGGLEWTQHKGNPLSPLVTGALSREVTKRVKREAWRKPSPSANSMVRNPESGSSSRRQGQCPKALPPGSESRQRGGERVVRRKGGVGGEEVGGGEGGGGGGGGGRGRR